MICDFIHVFLQVNALILPTLIVDNSCVIFCLIYLYMNISLHFQYSFAEHSEQQAALAQHLVGKVKQLQEANISIASDSNERMETTDETYYNEREEALSMVQDLTLELLNMVKNEQVYKTLNKFNLEIRICLFLNKCFSCGVA